MKIAVTGGAGFLGQHVVRELSVDGHKIEILDLVYPRWLDDVEWENRDVTFSYEDLEDINSVRQNIRDCDAVVHLAAVSNTRSAYQDPEKTLLVNSLGTQNVYRAAGLADVERVVLAGSSLVSGAQIRRDGRVDIGPDDQYTEDDPFDLSLVIHPYVMSKIHAEMIANVWGEQYGVDSTVFRYGIQYGRDMAPGVVAHAFITNALAGKPLVVNGDGYQWRQYTHVGDIAHAHGLLLSESLKSETTGTFNIVGSERVTINKMAEVVAEQTGVEVEHGSARTDDIEVKFCSNRKALDLLKWEPRISLEDGLKDTIDWYRRHGR